MNTRRLTHILIVLVMLFSTSASLGIEGASAATNSAVTGEWLETAPTPGQELTNRQSFVRTGFPQTSQLDIPLASMSGNVSLLPNASPVVLWHVPVGEMGYYIYDIAVDTAGNIYVTGIIFSTGDTSAFVAKLDSAGVTQWIYTFAGTKDLGISVDGYGSIYTAGEIIDPSTGDRNIFIAKLTNEGIPEWQRNFGDPAKTESADDIVSDQFGNVYVTGLDYRSSQDNIGDAFAARVNSSTGDLEWTTFLGGDYHAEGFGVSIGVNGNIYVTGGIYAQEDAFVARLDSAGTEIWYRTLGNSNDSMYGFGIAVNELGEVYVVGTHQDSVESGDPGNGFVAKLDSGGSVQWDIALGGSNFDTAYGIALDGDDVYVSGGSYAAWGCPSETMGQSYLAKIDGDNGSLKWNIFLENVSSVCCQATRVVTNGDGTLYVSTNAGHWVNSLAYVTRIEDSTSETILSPIAQAVLAEVGSQNYCGNHYETLITLPPGQAAFERFGVLAEGARYEIDFVTMGWDEHEDSYDPELSPGEVFLNSIKNLHTSVQANPGSYPRGVRVRILLGLKYYKPTDYKDQRVIIMNDLDRLDIPQVDPNWSVEVAVYQHAKQYPDPVLGSETSGKHGHVKMMIVDGKHIITGGYNMHYNYLGLDPDIPVVHDMGVQVSGPIAQNALQVFDQLWTGAYRCDQFDTDECTHESVILTSSHDPAIRISTTTGNDAVFSLFRDHTDKTADNAIAAAIASANTNINIIQNRFVNTSLWNPPQYARAILNALQKEDVEVHVKLLVSDGDGSLNGLVDHAANAIGTCMLETQLLVADASKISLLQIRKSTTDKPIHTKALSIDDSFIIVGSQNFDMSAWGQDESLVYPGELDLAEYSLGIESESAATAFNSKFNNEEWYNGLPLSCFDFKSLMLRSLEGLQFVKSRAGRLKIQMCPQGKMVKVSLDFQALQFENRIQHGKDMVVLCGDASHRRFTQSGVLFERFMEDFHRPSFLIGR